MLNVCIYICVCVRACVCDFCMHVEDVLMVWHGLVSSVTCLLSHPATPGNTRQPPATPCNTLQQHSTTHSNTLQRRATPCNTLHLQVADEQFVPRLFPRKMAEGLLISKTSHKYVTKVVQHIKRTIHRVKRAA